VSSIRRPGAHQGDERLLKLYESGLPAWAIYAPVWGVPYRPWLRTLTWAVFIAISAFSLACGFYDLYRNVPFLEQVCQEIHCAALQLRIVKSMGDL
jgi:hypothetical protein